MVDADLQESKITYAVTDTGMGVPAQEAERIFEPYVKLNSYFDGQGLGLTFARSIARRLGGDLVLDTTHTDKGARFVMTLPV
jgi:signal transduction histidine kinase